MEEIEGNVLLSESKSHLWFAVLTSIYDDDYEVGSADLETAKEMARRIGDNAYIAIVENGIRPVRVGTIERCDF